MTVGILGMAFKRESDDSRASLSYKLCKLLMRRGSTVLCTDPFVHDIRLEPLGALIERADVVIVGAPHNMYRDLDLADK